MENEMHRANGSLPSAEPSRRSPSSSLVAAARPPSVPTKRTDTMIPASTAPEGSTEATAVFRVPMTPAEKRAYVSSANKPTTLPSSISSTPGGASSIIPLSSSSRAFPDANASTPSSGVKWSPDRTETKEGTRPPVTPHDAASVLRRRPLGSSATTILQTPRLPASTLPCPHCTVAQDQVILLQTKLHALDVEHVAAQERILQVQREKAEVEWERNNALYEAEKAREEVIRLRAILDAKADDVDPVLLATQHAESLRHRLRIEKLQQLLGVDPEVAVDDTIDALEEVMQEFKVVAAQQEKERSTCASTSSNAETPLLAQLSLFLQTHATSDPKADADFSQAERQTWTELMQSLVAQMDASSSFSSSAVSTPNAPHSVSVAQRQLTPTTIMRWAGLKHLISS